MDDLHILSLVRRIFCKTLDKKGNYAERENHASPDFLREAWF